MCIRDRTNEVVSIRLQAAGKLVYGSPFELSVVTRPADVQYIGVVLGVKGEAKGYVTLVLSDKLRTLLKMIQVHLRTLQILQVLAWKGDSCSQMEGDDHLHLSLIHIWQ